jgi:Calcineurin-like phosphoesterase
MPVYGRGTMKRRHLLLLAGLLSSCGAVAQFGRQQNSQTAVSSTSPSLSGRAIGPKGFYAPVRGDVRIVVISDLNSQYGSIDYEPEVHQAIALIPGWQPDLVLCSGDMVAGMSTQLSDTEVQAMWKGFDRAIGAPLRKANLPLGFTLGNHDASGSTGAGGQLMFERDRNLAQAYWNETGHTPQLPFVDREHFPFYYSFVQNNVFYMVWDASTAVISAQQLVWAEKSLKSDPAQKAQIRIAIGHLPLYPVSVGREKPGEFLEQADQLRSLLEKYQVHTYISGHDHAYFPGHRGQLQLLQTGALGTGPRQWLDSSLSPRKTLTVVDIALKDASTRYTTYDLTNQTVLDAKILPRMISAPNGSVLRRDVDLNALTPAERTKFWA